MAVTGGAGHGRAEVVPRGGAGWCLAPVNSGELRCTPTTNLDTTDPTGLCSAWNPVCDVTSVSHSVAHAVSTGVSDTASGLDDAGSWVVNHPADIGIALGAVALAATGVGAFAELQAGGVLAATVIAGTTGAGAVTLDAVPCFHGDKLACVGAALGGVGAAFGVVGGTLDVMESGGLLPEALSGVGQFLDVTSLLYGTAGIALDIGGLFWDGGCSR